MSSAYLPESAHASRKDLANFDRRLDKVQMQDVFREATAKDRARIVKALGGVHPDKLHEDWRGSPLLED